MSKSVEELVTISAALRDSIFEMKLTKAEVYMVMGLLEAMVDDRAKVVISSPEASVKVEGKKVEVNRVKSKDIKYDPEYDPAPPMTSEPVPPREIDTRGKLLKSSGEACVCTTCGKVGYITNAPIIDGMKVDDFIAAFTAMDGYPSISRSIEIQNIDGNISTDCPRCKAQKKLYLVGREPAHESGISV